MSDNILNNVWPEWQIEKKLGRGSYGVVYQAVRKDHHVESHAAIKVISIPSETSEVDSLRAEGLDMNATRTYLQGIVNDFVNEIQLMESLKGIQNIVSVEDYKVVEKTGEIGWNIYIRMELLTPFNTYICDKKMTEKEVIKLGTDICTALEICSRRNIIHRDIKPENIFVNDFGDFKLGDFGIARKLENMTGGLSQKGTYNYMAPEVANSTTYDARADIYSLGIVLYRLLNNNRLPFLDTEKQLLNPNERRIAMERRIRGERLKAPCEASPAMAEIVLRACAYDPNVRFQTASEMKQALLSVANGTYRVSADDMLNRTTSVRKAPESGDQTVSVRRAPETASRQNSQTVNNFDRRPKKSKFPKIIAAILVIAIIAGACVWALPRLIGGSSDGETNESVQAAETVAETEPETEPEETDAPETESETAAETQETQVQTEETGQTSSESAAAQTVSDTIVKKYTGTYNTDEGDIRDLKGFDLEITSYDDNGNVEAVFSFYGLGTYDLTKDLYGSYKLNGRAFPSENGDGSTNISLTGTEWIEKPATYSMIDLDITINAEKTIVTSEEYDLYGVAEDASGMYPYTDIIKTYSGTYEPNWGTAGMDLTILSCDENTGEIQAECYFYPTEFGSEAKTGRFTMKGKIASVSPDGNLTIALVGDEWINQPTRANMLNLYATMNSAHDEITSENYEMQLAALQ